MCNNNNKSINLFLLSAACRILCAIQEGLNFLSIILRYKAAPRKVLSSNDHKNLQLKRVPLAFTAATTDLTWHSAFMEGEGPHKTLCTRLYTPRNGVWKEGREEKRERVEKFEKSSIKKFASNCFQSLSLHFFAFLFLHHCKMCLWAFAAAAKEGRITQKNNKRENIDSFRFPCRTVSAFWKMLCSKEWKRWLPNVPCFLIRYEHLSFGSLKCHSSPISTQQRGDEMKVLWVKGKFRTLAMQNQQHTEPTWREKAPKLVLHSVSLQDEATRSKKWTLYSLFFPRQISSFLTHRVRKKQHKNEDQSTLNKHHIILGSSPRLHCCVPIVRSQCQTYFFCFLLLEFLRTEETRSQLETSFSAFTSNSIIYHEIYDTRLPKWLLGDYFLVVFFSLWPEPLDGFDIISLSLPGKGEQTMKKQFIILSLAWSKFLVLVQHKGKSWAPFSPFTSTLEIILAKTCSTQNNPKLRMEKFFISGFFLLFWRARRFFFSLREQKRRR